MIILRKIQEVNRLLKKVETDAKTIGFIPTMGALHSGHLSLVEKSVAENGFTIVSIFVNPTQFNNQEDLKNYPRTENADIEILKNSGADAVFLPEVNEIYANGKVSEHFEFNGLENKMEGKFRPGHFDGVGTIVKKLLEIIRPDKAYFGKKDFQQLRIIQQMVESEKLNVKIIPVEIKREKDGLAMSSRNVRLTPEMREEAPKIYKILKKAKAYLTNHTIEETRKFVQNQFKSTKLKLEYFEIADEQTLDSVEDKNSNKKLRGFIAAFAGEIRLIDNLGLN
jgi:pantoate--beta-alanine ligase